MMESVAVKFSHLKTSLKGKKLIVILAVLLIGLILWFLWGRIQPKSGTYLTQEVVKGEVANVIAAAGAVEAENSVPLVFKNSALIRAIYVKEGQQVKKDELLAEQDDSDLRTQYNQQLANLKSAEAKLALAKAGSRQEDISQSQESVNIARITFEQAKLAFERNSTLFAQGAISSSDLEKSESDYKLELAKYNQVQAQLRALQSGNRTEDIRAAEASVDAARAQLQAAQNNLDSAKLIAPSDGVIGLVGAVVGQRTSGVGNAASSEDGFITLISDRLRVRAQVNEADIGRAAVGQKAFFTVNSYPDQKFTGVLESISPKAVTVSNVQLYEVVIALDQQDNELKVGMPANVSIIVEQKADVLLLPKMAVSYATQEVKNFVNKTDQLDKAGTQNNGQSNSSNQGFGGKINPLSNSKQVQILLMQGDKPALRQVQVGISDNSNYEIISGIKVGDKVVIGSTGQSSAESTNQSNTQNQGGFPPLGNAPRVNRQ